MNAFCAIVDWGTSNFRVWIVDHDGVVLNHVESDEGLKHCQQEGFEAVLEKHLLALDCDGDLPAVICGMAGSRQGWLEAPYINTPARLDDLISGSVRVHDLRRTVHILPGIAQRDRDHPDVMRGEETQLMGAAASLDKLDGFVCMPGTHSKWVMIRNAQVEGFSTFLTGELFSLLSKHSILKFGLADNEKALPDDSNFSQALSESMRNPSLTTNRLFESRAAGLLDINSPFQTASGLSGCLIGLEMAGVRKRFGDIDAVTLIGGGILQKLYLKALERMNIKTVVVDSDSAVRGGLFTAATALLTPEN